MNFRTQLPIIKRADSRIDYASDLLLLGSCFVENIGEKLDYFKFQNLQNPFGILFHPKAIEALISHALNAKVYTSDDIFVMNEQWHCFDAHSKLSSISKDDLINMLNLNLKLTHQQINKSTHIVITLGTAWVYRFLESNTIVANCHKVPQKQFEKVLLSVEDIYESLQNIVQSIKGINSNASIIFTVSPIRHIKDGFVENTQSKAHLLTAVHRLLARKEFLNCHYFPSYEIMMDELRDYRFYNEDMIHPNQTAINYIWETFKTVWISESISNTMDEVDVIQKGIRHKPFHAQSQAHQQFLQSLEAKKAALHSKFPNIVF
ncbi:GSCFA domain-containing protein [Changchengzhania lutea]|uniref:GSCFA domain-containing protein n=1 Tax=Changchengzhania lutea TaxID=2049305 RepID=UPI00115CEBA6|nr:GSCFA domain-containing protein [Changchengzhania lutea]